MIDFLTLLQVLDSSLRLATLLLVCSLDYFQSELEFLILVWRASFSLPHSYPPPLLQLPDQCGWVYWPAYSHQSYCRFSMA